MSALQIPPGSSGNCNYPCSVTRRCAHLGYGGGFVICREGFSRGFAILGVVQAGVSDWTAGPEKWRGRPWKVSDAESETELH
jgi:hypothetical protein